MSALPLPSDLGALALETLRQELIPALPPHLRYTAAMTVRALDYALTHHDSALEDGADSARALVEQITQGAPLDDTSALAHYLAQERAKVAPNPQK